MRLYLGKRSIRWLRLCLQRWRWHRRLRSRRRRRQRRADGAAHGQSLHGAAGGKPRGSCPGMLTRGCSALEYVLDHCCYRCVRLSPANTGQGDKYATIGNMPPTSYTEYCFTGFVGKVCLGGPYRNTYIQTHGE